MSQEMLSIAATHPVRRSRPRWTARLALVAALVVAAAPAAAQDAQAQRTAAERLRQAIDLDYSYRDLRQVDWTAQFEKHEPALLAAADAPTFAQAAAELLAEAKDVHIWLKVGERTVGTHQREARLNFNPRVLPKLIPQLKQHGKTALTGRFDNGTRYVAFGTFEHREPAAFDAALQAVAEAARDDAPLILDVRPNSGGDERLGQQIAALFVSEPVVYAKHILHQQGRDSEPMERRVEPDRRGQRHTAPCVVLMGPANMSSCESFLLMMRAAGRRLVGEASYGSSGNPRPHDLGNGVTAFLPSWRNLSADGEELEGTGIQPNVAVESKPEDFQRGDPVLKRALEILADR